jgi:hypothetical protein
MPTPVRGLYFRAYIVLDVWSRKIVGWRVEESWWREPIERTDFKVVGPSWLALVYLDRIAGTWH